jgi:hypothetical protein
LTTLNSVIMGIRWVRILGLLFVIISLQLNVS